MQHVYQAPVLAKSGAAQQGRDQKHSTAEQPTDCPGTEAQHAQQAVHVLNLTAGRAQHAGSATPSQSQQPAGGSNGTQQAQHASVPQRPEQAADAKHAQQAQQALAEAAGDLALPILEVLTTPQELKLHVMTACQLVERAVGSRTAVAAVSGNQTYASCYIRSHCAFLLLAQYWLSVMTQLCITSAKPMLAATYDCMQGLYPTSALQSVLL